jgi:uncharacterized protein YbaP (TraB family)
MSERGGMARRVTKCLAGAGLILGLLVWSATLLPAGEVYRWRDANGILHFADQPPPAAAFTVESSTPAPGADTPAADAERADAPGGGGVFWRVEGRGGGPPSYLLGTIHSDDPRVMRVVPELTSTLDKAATFVMEMELDADAFFQFGAAMLLAEGRDLAQLLGPADFRRVTEALADYGLPEAALRKVKPWVVLAMVSQPKPRSGQIMDLMLYRRAQAAGKPTAGLETAAEQIAVFNALSLNDQLDLLRATLDQVEAMPRMHDRLLATYLQNDLRAIETLARELTPDDAAGAGRRFMRRLNEERNGRMLARMLPHLDAGGAFVAVGALHLAGAEGLVAQLRARGFDLRPMP